MDLLSIYLNENCINMLFSGCGCFWCFEYLARIVTAFSHFMLLQKGVKFRLVTSCDITAGFTSRETSQNVVFTDHSVKISQIVAPSGFATRDIFMDRSSGLWMLLFFPTTMRNTSSGKVHGLTRACRMAKDTWRLVALCCFWLRLTTVKCDHPSMEEPSARLPCASKRREQSVFFFQIVKQASKLLT